MMMMMIRPSCRQTNDNFMAVLGSLSESGVGRLQMPRAQPFRDHRTTSSAPPVQNYTDFTDFCSLIHCLVIIIACQCSVFQSFQHPPRSPDPVPCCHANKSRPHHFQWDEMDYEIHDLGLGIIFQSMNRSWIDNSMNEWAEFFTAFFSLFLDFEFGAT